MRVAAILLSICLLTPAMAKKNDGGGWCCLCNCHSRDQNKCATMCIHMQHSKKIIEEPGINACTRACKAHGVPKIPPHDLR